MQTSDFPTEPDALGVDAPRDLGRTETVTRMPEDRAPRRRGRAWPWLVFVAALLGCYYAAISTHSFITWLDGQEHAISCSVVPGADAATGATGCRTAMLSTYSSLFRTSMWGGIPVSLAALGVFAFIAGFGVYLGLKKDLTRRDTGFLLLATLLPVGTSTAYAIISATKLGEFCTVCIGIYASSGAAFILALVGHFRAPRAAEGTPVPWGRWFLWFFEGVVLVGALIGIYVAVAPTDRPSVTKGCGELVKVEDEAKILLPMPTGDARDPAPRTPAIAVLDPLCPACRAFDRRLEASELDQRLSMQVLLFPLDSKCNWMVKSSLHPGACVVSEAMLCAPASAPRILEYAFSEQQRLLELGKTNEAALKADLEQHFPDVKGCVGSAAAKARVNKSLRWAVANALPVMTPQLFVGQTRICDEDTDLGLEYTLTKRLEAAH
ncbi:MAG: hypothetical protein JNJ59_03145 [Deltaproteobacteria bacterium]|nr:hypothetical protein [Deltaproteobacteria bacterium]